MEPQGSLPCLQQPPPFPILGTLYLRADDTAILASHVDPVQAAELLQRHLRLLETWMKRWRIRVNETKSTHITFTIHCKRKQLDALLKQMYWLLGRGSQLSLPNKILLYKTVLKPIWTCGISLWGTASHSNIEILQRFKTKLSVSSQTLLGTCQTQFFTWIYSCWLYEQKLHGWVASTKPN